MSVGIPVVRSHKSLPRSYRLALKSGGEVIKITSAHDFTRYFIRCISQGDYFNNLYSTNVLPLVGPTAFASLLNSSPHPGLIASQEFDGMRHPQQPH